MNEPTPQPPADEQLAEVQAALLDILHADLPPEQIVERLRSEPKLSAYADWVASFEPRMIETAALLVKKWGRRSSQTQTGQILEGG